VTAEGPLKLLPGSRYSVDFALSVVAGKFLNHLPYERQHKDMKRVGVDVPVATMYRLSEQVALHLGGVAEEIRKDIFNAPLACHLDETRWPILSNHDDDGQMWILSNQAGSYYRFEPTRSGKVADDLFEIERRVKTWELLKALRETESREKLSELKELLEKYRSEFFDQDEFCKAIHYVLSAWSEFTLFIEDVQLPLSNNDAERALRQRIGRIKPISRG